MRPFYGHCASRPVLQQLKVVSIIVDRQQRFPRVDVVLLQVQRSVSVGQVTKRPRVDRSLSVPPTSASVIAMLERHT